MNEVSVDINTTSAGSRNFIEIKVIPADQVFVNAMPCIPDLPCNDGWDYDDINGVGVGTDSQEGTGLTIAMPLQPDGYSFDLYNSSGLPIGDNQYAQCSDTDLCFLLSTHAENIGKRERFQHRLRDNGDGSLSFGVEQADGSFACVVVPGAFREGPARVVIAFHNYTGTKSGNGPGFNGNLSPSAGGFTWHWDNLAVYATNSIPSVEYFGRVHADRIITPNGCVSFAQGQRNATNNTDVYPTFHCDW